MSGLDDVTRWARQARTALRERDAAIRAAVAGGGTLRQVAAAAGMTHPAVRRILAREGAEGTRW